jgi:hypothetical protein
VKLPYNCSVLLNCSIPSVYSLITSAFPPLVTQFPLAPSRTTHHKRNPSLMVSYNRRYNKCLRRSRMRPAHRDRTGFIASRVGNRFRHNKCPREVVSVLVPVDHVVHRGVKQVYCCVATRDYCAGTCQHREGDDEGAEEGCRIRQCGQVSITASVSC